MVGYDVEGPTRDQLFKLIEKVKADSELRDENCVFERNNMGIQDSLIDTCGFLRSNIDVYKVRHARHKIICLKNSHKNIMKLIRQSLGETHSQFLVSDDEGPSCRKRCAIYAYDYEGPNNEDVVDSIKSFATVGLVQEGSPADLGGLCENDKILKFGPIDASSFTDIYQLQNIVKNSVGQPIEIRVKRDTQVLDVTVVPRQWKRPGIFGCQMMKQWCIVRITT